MRDNVETQKNLSLESEPAQRSHNRMLEECINYVKEHPVEVAAGTVLALGSIALLKGRGIQTAAQKIGLGATVESAEAGLMTKAAQLTDEGAQTIASGMGKANYGWTNTLRENIRLPQGVRTVEELHGLGQPGLKAAASSLDEGAGISRSSSPLGENHILSKYLREPLAPKAEGLTSVFDQTGYQPVPPRFSSAQIRIFDQTGYQPVPPRLSSAQIRLSNGPTMERIDGPSRIVFGDDNSVQRLLVNKSATAAEIQEQQLVAGYAGLIKDDALASEAAKRFTGRSIGFISEPVERFASPEQMQNTAIEGARAYIRGDKAGANRYTHFLTERYGAWNSAEHSLMNSMMGPRTDLVRQASKISPAPVPGTPPWVRNSGVRGVSEYLKQTSPNI